MAAKVKVDQIETVDGTGNITINNSVTMAANQTLPAASVTGTHTTFRSTGIDDNADALAITIDSAENVGIGTTAPLRQLHISNTSANSEIAFTSGTSGAASLLFGDGLTGTDIYRGYIQYQHSGDYMLIATGATDRLRVDADGLKFNADTAAANALDDYEEGEVTNALDINGTTQTSYSSGRGNLQYTKVGRNVHIQAYLDTGSETLATTGALHIRLPFAVTAGSGTAFCTGAAHYIQWVNGVGYPSVAYLNEGDSTISGNYLSSDGNASSITEGSTIEVSSTGHRVIHRYSFSYQTD